MYNHRQATGWSLLTLLVINGIIVTIAYPQQQQFQSYRSIDAQYPAQQQFEPSQQYYTQQKQAQPIYKPQENESSAVRKFAVKPNASKKVALDDIDADLQTNQLQEATQGFSWSNMLATVLQMFFNGGVNSPTKSDDIEGGFQQSPWANVISVGLKIITTLLGGGAPSDGIDKVDNGGSPMQNIFAAVFSSVLGARDPDQVNTMAKQAGEFLSIVMNLLDALKTSFSHRSLEARSLGKRDSVSDAAVASLSMVKSFARTYKNSDDKCMQKYLCEANTDCLNNIGGASIFCQLGTYATSFMLERTTNSKFENLYDAGRRGRSGVDCKQVYLECNEV